MKIILAIGAGSFIGGSLRYLISTLLQNKFQITFPLGTSVVNIIGCFLIGLLYAMAAKTNMTPEFKLFLGSGVLGGFTTFSAFSLETVTMLHTGYYYSAILYILTSVILGIFATISGVYLLKLLW